MNAFKRNELLIRQVTATGASAAISPDLPVRSTEQPSTNQTGGKYSISFVSYLHFVCQRLDQIP
jgi:hypothetical protein